jgi:hypothetical protein
MQASSWRSVFVTGAGTAHKAAYDPALLMRANVKMSTSKRQDDGDEEIDVFDDEH